MSGPLEGKVALVSGATRGGGRGIAVALGEAGATVYATGRSTREGDSEIDRTETIEETARCDAAAARASHGVDNSTGEAGAWGALDSERGLACWNESGLGAPSSGIACGSTNRNGLACSARDRDALTHEPPALPCSAQSGGLVGRCPTARRLIRDHFRITASRPREDVGNADRVGARQELEPTGHGGRSQSRWALDSCASTTAERAKWSRNNERPRTMHLGAPLYVGRAWPLGGDPTCRAGKGSALRASSRRLRLHRCRRNQPRRRYMVEGWSARARAGGRATAGGGALRSTRPRLRGRRGRVAAGEVATRRCSKVVSALSPYER